MKQHLFTKEGYENLKKEREDLKAQRKLAVIDLTKARELGDLSENGYYKAARFKLNAIDHRLYKIAIFLKYGKIIESDGSDSVQVGHTVTLSTGNETVDYHIVGSEEANPKEGRISNESPLGRLLLGKKLHEVVALNTPARTITYTIKAIKG